MVQRIRELLRAAPFVPFKIKTSNGREYVVATSDHAAVSPNNTKVLILGDDDSQTTLSGLHVVAVEEGASPVSK